jgi:hypothetical protein
MDENGNQQQNSQPNPPQNPETTRPPTSPIPQSISGSQLTEQTADEHHQKMTRQLILISAGVVAAAVILVILAAVYGSGIGNYLISPLVNTTYTNANVKYNLKFYAHSTQRLSNNLDWMTQGGKKHLDSTTTVLVSPPLGKYGTGVAIFIVPIPTDKQPLLPKSSCTDLSGLTQVSAVRMQADGSTAVICGEKSNGKFQVEYLFQFTQRNMTYVGFILMPYNWKQVTANPTTAKAFLAYATLTKYNSAIDTIVSSIQVQN